MRLRSPDEFNCIIFGTGKSVLLADQSVTLRYGLDHPLGCPPLLNIAKGKNTAIIVICDITRPAPNQKTLPSLLKLLLQTGIRTETMTILIAAGLHQVAVEAHVDQIVGSELAQDCQQRRKSARPTSLSGTTARGIPVYIRDPEVCSQELFMTNYFSAQK